MNVSIVTSCWSNDAVGEVFYHHIRTIVQKGCNLSCLHLLIKLACWLRRLIGNAYRIQFLDRWHELVPVTSSSTCSHVHRVDISFTKIASNYSPAGCNKHCWLRITVTHTDLIHGSHCDCECFHCYKLPGAWVRGVCWSNDAVGEVFYHHIRTLVQKGCNLACLHLLIKLACWLRRLIGNAYRIKFMDRWHELVPVTSSSTCFYVHRVDISFTKIASNYSPTGCNKHCWLRITVTHTDPIHGSHCDCVWQTQCGTDHDSSQLFTCAVCSYPLHKLSIEDGVIS